jgi:hypothetical protein
VHIAPFGGLTSNHQTRPTPSPHQVTDSTAARPRREWKVVDNRTNEPRSAASLPQRKEVTAADVKYSVDGWLNPPLPGSVATLGLIPSITSAEVRSKYVIRLKLAKPDARLYGFLAWNRYSPIVPEGMYQQVNAGREGIGTGPFRLVSYVPGQGVEYAAYANYRKRGLPYLNQLSLPTLPDEQARIAALRAGAIDGATLSADGARSFQGNSNFVVLRGLTAAFRELQFTIKPGENKPWHDKRVRQAVNFAINRQEILDRVYNGFGEYSGHVPPGYGPWPLTRAELRNRYLKFDLAKARTLMRQAGFATASGDDVGIIGPRLRAGGGRDRRGSTGSASRSTSIEGRAHSRRTAGSGSSVGPATPACGTSATADQRQHLVQTWYAYRTSGWRLVGRVHQLDERSGCRYAKAPAAPSGGALSRRSSRGKFRSCVSA